MRKIFTLLILVLLPVVLFAAIEPTFEQKSECLLVDLASTRFVRHTNNATWASGSGTNANYYYDNQILSIIGLVGDKAKDHDVILSAELVSGKWAYILNGSDIRYMRPFGIQIIGRGKPTLSGSGSTHTNLGTSYNIYMGGDSDGVVSEVVLPQSEASKYEGIWWDMVLVFDYNADTTNDTVLGADGLTYNLVSSDDYYTAIVKLTIQWGDTDEEKRIYTVYLNGYYKSSNTYSGSDSTIVSTLNVDKLSSGNSIDIKTLFNGYSESASDQAQLKQNVASYSYTTNTVSGKKDGYVMFFLSSVSSGLNSGGQEFTLRHINSDGSVSYRDTNHNSLRFYAYIDSDRGHSSSEADTVQGTSVKFVGTEYFSSAITGDYVRVEAETYKDQDGNWHTRWHDTGFISVAIPSEQSINGNQVTLESLVAGQYTSNIYFHIIANY